MNDATTTSGIRIAQAGASGRLVAGVECYVGTYGRGYEIQAGSRTIWRGQNATLAQAQERLRLLRAGDVRS